VIKGCNEHISITMAIEPGGLIQAHTAAGSRPPATRRWMFVSVCDAQLAIPLSPYCIRQSPAPRSAAAQVKLPSGQGVLWGPASGHRDRACADGCVAALLGRANGNGAVSRAQHLGHVQAAKLACGW